MYRMKRTLAVMISVVFLFCASALALTANADYTVGSEVASGRNLGINWSLTANDVDSLTLSISPMVTNPSGAMADYTATSAPWHGYASQITVIDLASGISSIGDYAFNGLTALDAYMLTAAVTDIGDYAFNGCSALSLLTIPENSALAAIGAYAFAGCAGDFSVTVVSDDAFTLGTEAFGASAAAVVHCPAEIAAQFGAYTVHVYSEVTTATCTEAGTTTYTCEECEDFTPIVVAEPALGHLYDDGVYTDPTCTEDGYTTYTCQRDGCGYQNVVTDTGTALGHDYTAWTSNDDGTHTRGCTRCDFTETQDCNYTSSYTEPTCVEDGFTTYTCSDCGYSYDVPDSGTALGHDYTDVAWTSDGAGNHYRDCTRCGEAGRDTVACTYDEGVYTPPTCTEDGYTTYTCTVCGYSYDVTDTGTALGHDYTGVAWTSDGAGHHYRDCTVCGEAGRDTADCTFDEGVYTPPTCTEDGYTTYTCTVCGYSYDVTDTGSALGHDYTGVEWTSDGHGHHYKDCTRCGDAARITEDCVYNSVTTPATCTEDAYITYTCMYCGDQNIQTLTGTAGHHYVETIVTAPTCTEAGLATYTCSACGDTYEEVLPATGHHYVSVVTEPTCKEAGFTTYTCTVCGDTYVVAGPPAHGHVYVDNVCIYCGAKTSTFMQVLQSIVAFLMNIFSFLHIG